MMNRHFKNGVAGQLEKLRSPARHLDNERQDIKSRLFSPPPAKMVQIIRQLNLRRIAQDSSIRLPIARVPDQLWVPDAYPWLTRNLWCKDGDHGTNTTSISRNAEVFSARLKNILGT